LRKRSAGYLASTSASRSKGALNDEMDRKVTKDEKKPLPDSDEEELGLDGKPKHRFYNEELEIKTKAI